MKADRRGVSAVGRGILVWRDIWRVNISQNFCLKEGKLGHVSVGSHLVLVEGCLRDINKFALLGYTFA